MARRTAPSYARLLEYQKRQVPARWGHRYEPAIRANSSEAPSSSHCHLIRAIQLNRDVHALSNVERDAVLLALWHPALLDLHEQRLLSPIAAEHPLAGSPYTLTVSRLPPLQGTYVVATSLGIERSHPTVSGPPDPEPPHLPAIFPFPLVGDLLLFLQDEQGPFCVNWNIKSRPEHFRLKSHGTLRQRSSRTANEHVQHRQQIERHYYADAQIPTTEIAGTDLDPVVMTNLRMLLPTRLADAPAAAVRDLEVLLNEGINLDRPPTSTFDMVIRRHGVSAWTCTEIAKQLIWSKHVAVDLYTPVLWDQPLRVASRCVLRERDAWFRRWSA